MEMEKLKEWKGKKEIVRSASGEPMPAAEYVHRAPCPVNLAAVAVSLNVRLRSSDMPRDMQERALRLTRSLLDASKRPPSSSTTSLARALKKEFDTWYGLAWHCVAGKSFGSFVTHSPGGFLYFSIDDSFSLLLFKTELRLVAPQSPPPLPPPRSERS